MLPKFSNGMRSLDLLKRCFWFSCVDSASLLSLARFSKSKIFNKGEMIFSEDDKAEYLYILADGAVDLVKSVSSGKEHLVRSVGKGEMFAEAAMFSGDSYPATAVAKVKSQLFAINKKDFIAFIEKHPDASLKIMGTMARLLRHLNLKLAEVSLGSVSSRLAGYLLLKFGEYGDREFPLDLKKKDLAFKLGTIPETLSRIFKKFEVEGIISLDGKLIKINKIDMLRSLGEK